MKFLNNFKWYRKFIGGTWYKHTLPNNDQFWSKKKHFKYYTLITKLEYYNR